MILIQCNDKKCQHAFELLSVRTKKGVMYDLRDKLIKCECCGSADVSRMITPSNEGMPSFGKYSATNEINRTK